MSIATKNGSVIVSGGRVARNCACCAFCSPPEIGAFYDQVSASQCSLALSGSGLFQHAASTVYPAFACQEDGRNYYPQPLANLASWATWQFFFEEPSIFTTHLLAFDPARSYRSQIVGNAEQYLESRVAFVKDNGYCRVTLYLYLSAFQRSDAATSQTWPGSLCSLGVDLTVSTFFGQTTPSSQVAFTSQPAVSLISNNGHTTAALGPTYLARVSQGQSSLSVNNVSAVTFSTNINIADNSVKNATGLWQADLIAGSPVSAYQQRSIFTPYRSDSDFSFDPFRPQSAYIGNDGSKHITLFPVQKNRTVLQWIAPAAGQDRYLVNPVIAFAGQNCALTISGQPSQLIYASKSAPFLVSPEIILAP